MIYLNQTTGECFRAIRAGNGEISFLGAFRDEAQFESGLTQVAVDQVAVDDPQPGKFTEFPYGVHIIELVEGEEADIELRGRVHVDDDPVYDAVNSGTSEAILNYQVSDDDGERRDEVDTAIRSCLNADNNGTIDSLGSGQGMNCNYNLVDAPNLNDNYLSDTTTISNTVMDTHSKQTVLITIILVCGFVLKQLGIIEILLKAYLCSIYSWSEKRTSKCTCH